ncbi:hypothetical protein DV735_g4232, partial [Chaetothyriales sp. CBS 134920]
MCRLRKIRCDRSPVTCNNCRRFGAQCSYSASGRPSNRRIVPSAGTTQAGLERRRVRQSCVACKQAKAKCSGGQECLRCAKRHLVCTYASQKQLLSPSTCSSSPPGGGADTRQPLADPSTNAMAMDDWANGSPGDGVPSWLMASTLPAIDQLRTLVDTFFLRIHTVRCLGFLHMPSFFARLQEPERLYADVHGLLHAICALAAPFHYANIGTQPNGDSTDQGPDAEPHCFYTAGSAWAATALQRVFARMSIPDVEGLMAIMLLHEHSLRTGAYAQAFLLSGLSARYAQLLQLNLEADDDVLCLHTETTADTAHASTRLSFVAKETRRRLVWHGFLMDAFIECGIDQLRFVNPTNIQVQLPCKDDLFQLSSAPAGVHGHANLGLRAFYIRAMALRSKVLKYVKHLEGDVPWRGRPRSAAGAAEGAEGGTEGASQFNWLDGELAMLEASVPDGLRMSPDNACLFRASGRLNLFFGLHILLAQTCYDLYRVGVAGLVFPHHATDWIRTHAPPVFLQRCHQVCAAKAIAIARLLQELWVVDRPSLIDTPYAVHAQVCSSVLATTLGSWHKLSVKQQRGGNRTQHGVAAQDAMPPLFNPPVSVTDQRGYLQSNVAVLDYIRRYIKADSYYESARQALRYFDQLSSSPDLGAEERPRSSNAAAATTSLSLEDILNPLGVYPMARQQARECLEPSVGTQGDSSSVPVADTNNRQILWGDINTTGPSELPIAPSNLPPALDHTVIPDILVNPGESLFPMWDWETDLPSIDNMGYPTFFDSYHGSLQA